MKYTIDYFIDKFESIPEKNYTSGVFEKTKKSIFRKNIIKNCAQGHCGMNKFNKHSVWEEPLNMKIEASVLYYMFGEDTHISIINNGQHPQYQQNTEKQRILAALRDMKNGDYPHMEGEYWEINNKMDRKINELMEH